MTEQDFGASVPEGDDLVSIGLNWQTKSSRQTEVRKFDVLSSSVYKQVLRLQISMENSVLMEVD